MFKLVLHWVLGRSLLLIFGDPLNRTKTREPIMSFSMSYSIVPFCTCSIDPFCTEEWNTTIVIPAPEMIVDSRTFTCLGSGLLHNRYKFDAYVERFLSPLPTEAGRVKIEEQPLAYWRAQCAFRNLMQKNTMEDLEIEDLQCWLRERHGAMDVHLAKAEKDLNKEFWRKNAVERKARWNMRNDSWKAGANPERFLREKLQNLGDDDIVHLKLCKSAPFRGR